MPSRPGWPSAGGARRRAHDLDTHGGTELDEAETIVAAALLDVDPLPAEAEVVDLRPCDETH